MILPCDRELGIGCYTDPAYVDGYREAYTENGTSISKAGCTNEDLPSCPQYEQTSIAFTGDLLRSMEVVPDSFPATSDVTPLGGCCSICTCLHPTSGDSNTRPSGEIK